VYSTPLSATTRPRNDKPEANTRNVKSVKCGPELSYTAN
jgi:hypothetical protein